MSGPRTYDVGDRVTIVGGPKLRADTGVVVEVKQDPLPYRVDFGAPWTPAWWSGLDLEPAPAPDPWAEVAIAANAPGRPKCLAPFCGRVWGAGMRQRVFGVTGVAVCTRPACVAWGELRSDELLDGYEWREHAARMRRGDCQPRRPARKVDGEFSSVAEHIAAWKAGGRRWAKVEGFNVDAWQADEEAKRMATAEAARPRLGSFAAVVDTLPSPCPTVDVDPADARFDAVAAMLAADPVQAARCGVPAEVPRDDWGPLPDDLVAAIAAAHIASMPASTGGEACPTCGAVKGER